MSASELFQLPSSYAQIEQEHLSYEESIKIIDIYNSMYNDNLSKQEKISNLKKLLDMFFGYEDIYMKKLLCLIYFSILNTTFAYSIIQENERFRKVVFEKYEEFINLPDQDFVEALKIRRI